MKTIHIKNADDLLDLCKGYIGYLPKDGSYSSGRPRYVRGISRTYTNDGRPCITFIHHNADITILSKDDLDKYIMVFSRRNPYNHFHSSDDYLSELVFDIEY